MELSENEVVKLDDGNKYWVIKKIAVDDIIFYYTVNISSKKVAVLADRYGLEIVEDEQLLNMVCSEVLVASVESPRDN